MGSPSLNLGNGKKEGMSSYEFPITAKTNKQTKILILMENIQKHKALHEIPKFFKKLLPYYYIMKFNPNHQPPKFLIHEEV